LQGRSEAWITFIEFVRLIILSLGEDRIAEGVVAGKAVAGCSGAAIWNLLYCASHIEASMARQLFPLLLAVVFVLPLRNLVAIDKSHANPRAASSNWSAQVLA
jgi:hypothetical protein